MSQVTLKRATQPGLLARWRYYARGLADSRDCLTLWGPAELEPIDCREPGRCAVVIVVSRLNPVRFDGGDIPSIAGDERRSQLFLTDGVRASVGTIVTEAHHIQSSIVLGHRRWTRHVLCSLV